MVKILYVILLYVIFLRNYLAYVTSKEFISIRANVAFG